MDQKVVFVAIVGMALVTYGPRLFPFLALKSRTLSPVATKWLGYVPAAVLAAMLVPALLLKEGRVETGMDNLFLWASLPVFFLAARTRSLFGAVALGMGLVAAARFFLGE
jgi:branched-subunit amino acid transport protein